MNRHQRVVKWAQARCEVFESRLERALRKAENPESLTRHRKAYRNKMRALQQRVRRVETWDGYSVPTSKVEADLEYIARKVFELGVILAEIEVQAPQLSLFQTARSSVAGG